MTIMESQNFSPQAIASQSQQMVRKYPVPLMLACMGAGFGVGLMVSSAIMEMIEASHPRRQMGAVEKYRHQVYDAVAHLLPEKYAKHLHM